MRPLSALGLVTIAVGCGTADADVEWSTVDSAGIEIVDSRAPAWKEGGEWRVAEPAALDLSRTGEGEAHEFFFVADADRFDDGWIAVADRGVGTVRIYDADGRHLTSLGRKGEGPGEFQSLAQIWAVEPDTVIAFDRWGRFSWYRTSGEFVRDERAGTPGEVWAQLSRFDDGGFIATLGWRPGELDPGARGLIELATPVVALTPGRGAADTLVSLPGAEIYRIGEPGRDVIGYPPLAMHVVARTAGSVFVAGAGDGMRFDVRDASGDLIRRVGASTFDLTGAATLAEEIVANQLDESDDPESRSRTAAIFDQLPTPEERPGYVDLQVDPDGNVWMGDHRGPIYMYPSGTWQVFAPSGRWLGGVDMPARFRALRFGRDWVLGYHLDELDVHHVRLYRIEKPDA